MGKPREIIILNEKEEVINLFPTAREAAKYFNIYDSHLYKMLNGEKKFTLIKNGKLPEGHQVKYKDEYENDKNFAEKEKTNIEKQMINYAEKLIRGFWFEKGVSSETGISINKLKKIAKEIGHKVVNGQYVPWDW